MKNEIIKRNYPAEFNNEKYCIIDRDPNYFIKIEKNNKSNVGLKAYISEKQFDPKSMEMTMGNYIEVSYKEAQRFFNYEITIDKLLKSSAWVGNSRNRVK